MTALQADLLYLTRPPLKNDLKMMVRSKSNTTPNCILSKKNQTPLFHVELKQTHQQNTQIYLFWPFGAGPIKLFTEII